MLSKGLKKFKDRIFSASRKEGSQSGTDYSEGPDSPGVGSPRKFSSIKSKNSSYGERNLPEGLVATSSMRSNASAAVTLKESPMLQDHAPSPTGRDGVLPPVAITDSNSSFTSKGQAPPQLASMLNPSSGRRKSTPAALDMVLRTAEGKAAVEQLLQPQQNKLVFGNYFAGTSAAARDQAAAVAASEKQRAKAGSGQVAPAPPPLLIPKPPSAHPPPGTSPSSYTRPSAPAVVHVHSDNAMATVPEDVAMDDVRHAAPSNAKKHPADSVSSMQGYQHASPASTPHKIHAVSPTASRPPSASASAFASHSMPHLPSSNSVPIPSPLRPQHSHPHPPAAPHPSSMPLPPPLPPPPQPPPQPQPPPPPPQPAAPPPPAEESPSTSSRAVAKLVSISSQMPAAMQRKYWSLADYNIIRKMYTGYASTVYQAMCKKSLDMVALKVYHMQNLCELNHYQVFREIRVHSSLQHQNIIHLFAAFQEGTDVVLVQEYAEGGDLYRLLHKNGGRLSERQAVEMVLHPFLLALHYLHMRGIMHRDIKPENVLFTEHRVLKLADFGLAIDLTEERAVTRAGTLDYMAPEVLRCPPKNLPQENKNNPYLHYNNSVDAWAVGVFAYELVVGFPPFAGETQLDSVDRIMHSVPEFPAKMSEFAKDFICQCLRKHPGDRPTVMELLHHPWVRTFQRRTSMRITTVPRRRSSVVLNPGSLQHGGGSMGVGHGGANGFVPREAAEEGLPEGMPDGAAGGGGGTEGGAAPMDTDVNEMTPEEIEHMIMKLQVAKAQAIAKSESQRQRAAAGGSAGGSEFMMQAVQPLQS